MKNRNDKIKIICTEQEDNLYFFDIDYNGVLLSINCYITVRKGKLLLTKVDVEGPGQNKFGMRMIKIIHEIAREFCIEYKCHSIEIKGATRTVGRTKGRILQPIIFAFDDLKEHFERKR